MVKVRGHWRNGHRVRKHTRRGRTGGAVGAVCIVAVGGYALVGGWSPFQARPVGAPKVVGTYHVAKVLSGDTVQLRIDGRQTKVRLLGVKSPPSGRTPQACGSKEAAAATARLLLGKAAVLIAEQSPEADEGETDVVTGYLERDGIDVGLQLLRAGHATLPDRDVPHEREDEYRASEDEARTGQIGLWGRC